MTIEGLCKYYYTFGGECEFKRLINGEIQRRKKAELISPSSPSSAPAIEDLVAKSNNAPSGSHPAEMADILMCNARGFAGLITFQVVVDQQKCDCYQK